MASRAVLVMAYGSPSGPDEVEAYLTHIRGGERPTAEGIEDLRRRYNAIGGRSPLPEITRAQAAELEEALRRKGVADLRVVAAMKHAPPFIGEKVAEVCALGAEEVVGLVAAPHYSRMSMGAYERALTEAVAKAGRGVKAKMVRSWHLEPALIDGWAGEIRVIKRARGEFDRLDAAVLFSAHSLPVAAVAGGDPYPEQVAATCRAVAKAAGVSQFAFAWQSAGHRGKWLGPPIAAELERLASEGVKAVVSAPVGFTADHLEVLYDLDIELREQAGRLGVAFARAPMPNAAPWLIDAILGAVEKELAAA